PAQPPRKNRPSNLGKTALANPLRKRPSLPSPRTAVLTALDDISFERRKTELMMSAELEQRIEKLADPQLELRFASPEPCELRILLEQCTRHAESLADC